MSLSALIDRVQRERRTITLYAPEPSEPLETHFEGQYATVEHVFLPAEAGPPFLTVREGGRFLGAIGAEALRALADPPGDTPFGRREGADALRPLLDLLAETQFVAFDREQMLAASREFEERAWRVGAGEFHAGFRSVAALAAQRDVYDQLATRDGLSVTLYVPDADLPTLPGVTVRPFAADADADVWFVAFDAADPAQSCALVGEEGPDGFRGFWTYDASLVREVVAAVGPESGPPANAGGRDESGAGTDHG